jgi:hypothetical protein
LNGLRDLSTIQWYIIPLLAIVVYIWTIEIRKARESGNWNPIWAGAAVFGMDFINETWNGWVFHVTQHSAFWTTPGPTALRTLIGWNIEIMFMFAILGLIYGNTISEDYDEKILGISNHWFYVIMYSIICVFVEVILNIGGQLVWEYPWWNASITGIWLIFFIGYFPFFTMALIVINLREDKHRKMVLGAIYGFAIIGNIVCLGILGWVY